MLPVPVFVTIGITIATAMATAIGINIGTTVNRDISKSRLRFKRNRLFSFKENTIWENKALIKLLGKF